MSSTGRVHVIVPPGIDDPARPSGGNSYDRRVCTSLEATGWDVRLLPVDGQWPRPDQRALTALDWVLAELPDDAVVLIDGLIASAAPTVLSRQTRRLRLVILLHMALGDAAEGAALSTSRAVITTSEWLRRRIIGLHSLVPDQVRVATPGVDPAELAPGTADGGELLCVGAVAPHKGQDVLMAALSELAGVTWRCVCAGSLDIDRGFVERLRHQITDGGIGDRVRLVGPLTGAGLAQAYAQADVLVLASESESYGMVVTEALACGLPVIAGTVGGVPEALGRTDAGRRPGLLLPPGDPAALREGLRRWLDDGELRASLRDAARERRAMLSGWDATGRRVSGVLNEVVARAD